MIQVTRNTDSVSGRSYVKEVQSTPSPSMPREMQTDPFSGYRFIFRTRRGTAISVLQYYAMGFLAGDYTVIQGRFRSMVGPHAPEPLRTLRRITQGATAAAAAT